MHQLFDLRYLRPVIMLLPICISCTAVPAPTHNQLSSAERAAGWQLLFDGQSSAQWRSYGGSGVPSNWHVGKQTLELQSGGGGDLITRSSWRNFELRLDWNISEGGNSGIFFLADESDLPIFVHAPEIQILDDARHADNKLATRRSGSLYDLVAAPADSQKPAGQWNEVKIVHNERHLQVWQNDVQTLNIVVGSARWNELVANSKFANWPGFGEQTSGHIGLQDHGDPVSFRNLKIRSLSVAN